MAGGPAGSCALTEMALVAGAQTGEIRGAVLVRATLVSTRWEAGLSASLFAFYHLLRTKAPEAITIPRHPTVKVASRKRG
jgi:hypothetical protein